MSGRNNLFYDDDDDLDESSSSPFYGLEDDDDDLYDDEDDDLYGTGSSSRDSGYYSGSRASSGSRGSTYGSDSYGRSSSYSSKPAITRDDVSHRQAQPKDRGRTARPRASKGSSRFDRQGDKSEDSVMKRLGGGLSSLRKRLPSGKSADSATRSKTSRDRSSSSRASSTRSLGPSQSRFSTRSDTSRTRDRDIARSGEKKSRFSLSNPFKRSDSGQRQTGRDSARSRSSSPSRPSSTPSRTKKARPLPKKDRRPQITNKGISLDRKLDIAGIAMMIVAVVIFFGAISGNEGEASSFVLNIIYQLVGFGWFAVPLALGGIGFWLILRHFGEKVPQVDYVQIVGWIVTYIGALATFHFLYLFGTTVASVEQLQYYSDQAAELGQGGGWLGGQLYMFLVASLGDFGTFFALLGWWIVGLILATDLSVAGIVGAFSLLTRRVQTRYKFARADRSAKQRQREGMLEVPTSAASAVLEQATQESLPEPGETAAAPALQASPTLEIGTVSPAQEVTYAQSETATEEAQHGAITVRPGLTRLRRRASVVRDEPPDDVIPQRVIASASVTEATPDEAAPRRWGRQLFGGGAQVDASIDESDDALVRDERMPISPGPEKATPSAPLVEPVIAEPQPTITAPPFAEEIAEAPDNSDGAGGAETTSIDDAFLQPAQPRDPERAQRRLQARQRGAGLSPAERAALEGVYAASDDDVTDEDESAAEMVSDNDEVLADEPVYEPVLDAALQIEDDVPAIELEDDEAEDESLWRSPDSEVSEPVAAVSSPEVEEEPVEPEQSAPVNPEPERPTPVIRNKPRREVDLDDIRGRTTATHTPAPTATTSMDSAPKVAIPSGTQSWDIPDFMTILEPSSEQHIDDDILLDRARVIEDTLNGFGAPGNVVEVNPGPVITQFGVEPDYVESRGGKRTRVKVQSIARLADDLALALAARSIRIEAPVPGKGFVGIEVPNTEIALVSLRDVMESREFKKLQEKTSLVIGLGQSVDGTPVAANLTEMPHLLIAGTTGSGKSVCVNAIIASLLLQNTPDQMRFIMVDPKRVELTGYNGIPHLVAPVVVELERIVGVLKWVTREMDERYKKFNQAGARNIADYNKRIVGKDEKPLPYLVIIVDELADLMMLAPDETERVITRLAQMARATGIHLIISTQRPSVDIITGLIKANFPSRVAFAVASSVDSRVILDQPGAERLLGRGDMLFQAPNAAAPARLQGVFVSDDELNALVRYWKGIRSVDDRPASTPVPAPGRPSTASAAPTIGTLVDRTEKSSSAPSISTSSSPWDAVAPIKKKRANGADGDNVDEMYEEAVEVVRGLRKASVSLLQRQLRIGYTRAARLIDIMEERGIVGPAQSGSKPRKVIGYTDDDL